jgi:hypothetical protein
VFAAIAVVLRAARDRMSIKKIVRWLRPLQQVSDRIAGHDYLAEDPFAKPDREIIDALNLNRQ